MPVFLKTKDDILFESFSLESFTTWAERKLKGYSAGEVDHLAKKVYEINSESNKKAVIERILNAITDAKEKLKVTDDNVKKKLIHDHIEVLNKLMSYAHSYDPVSQAAKNAEERKEEAERLRDRSAGNTESNHRVLDLNV